MYLFRRTRHSTRDQKKKKRFSLFRVVCDDFFISPFPLTSKVQEIDILLRGSFCSEHCNITKIFGKYCKNKKKNKFRKKYRNVIELFHCIFCIFWYFFFESIISFNMVWVTCLMATPFNFHTSFSRAHSPTISVKSSWHMHL